MPKCSQDGRPGVPMYSEAGPLSCFLFFSARIITELALKTSYAASKVMLVSFFCATRPFCWSLHNFKACLHLLMNLLHKNNVYYIALFNSAVDCNIVFDLFSRAVIFQQLLFCHGLGKCCIQGSIISMAFLCKNLEYVPL